ncbi:hypothetical protein [Methylomonas sp. ZR1]|uniref:hypothetical protein n=1 Tax=Methylomonas sp. ZR1 TaxID=1797072 RepID=UPI001492E116|nr:hypothetical protein [Methylomonas sp. ZR1]NOV29529.1 hypothetical protein [Methylomonas sp. ZR1]
MRPNLKIVIPLLATVLLASGCATRQLKNFKEAADENNWHEIAGAEVDCKADDETCNQLHLLKGDACYRLAKQNTDSIKNYQCAAEQLEQGIHLTTDWAAAEAIVGQRAQYFENWCESLRSLRSEQTSTAAAKPYNQKLHACAREFLQAPGDLKPAATFFLHNAELAAIRFQIDDTGSCQALKQLQQNENQAAAQAGQSRYADYHRRLLNDIAGIKASIPGCP